MRVPRPLLPPLAAELLARCRFPPRGTAISCAVSGGPDSLALLALAVASGCDVTAFHVDHGLRPGSRDEARIVAAQAAELGAAFVARSARCSPGPNLEARARAARFGALPDDVATGHTADDQAETIVLNLLRGSGIDGLCGMTPGPRHPILGLRRAETERLATSLGLPIVRDPTNAAPEHRRNRIRAEVLPLLCEIAQRDIVGVLARQAGLLAGERALLDHLATQIDVSSAPALAQADPALARRALRRYLRDELELEHPLELAAIERALSVARGEVAACELPGGARLSRSHGRLRLERPGR